MHFSLLYVSEKPSAWVEQACQFYIKRLPTEFGFRQTRISPVKRTKNSHTDTVKQQEWQRINEKAGKQSLIVLLDERGKQFSSEQFSQQIGKWQHLGQDIDFIIAGADGVMPEHRQQADAMIALSQLTLPHEMVRLFLIEQLYRGWTILTNHPYHRV
jgi:23S rRNA (pseudouridine1915-N3)-methyltransferase